MNLLKIFFHFFALFEPFWVTRTLQATNFKLFFYNLYLGALSVRFFGFAKLDIFCTVCESLSKNDFHNVTSSARIIGKIL